MDNAPSVIASQIKDQIELSATGVSVLEAFGTLEVLTGTRGSSVTGAIVWLVALAELVFVAELALTFLFRLAEELAFDAEVGVGVGDV